MSGFGYVKALTLTADDTLYEPGAEILIEFPSMQGVVVSVGKGTNLKALTNVQILNVAGTSYRVLAN